MAILGFVLECAVVTAAIAAGASLLSLATTWALRLATGRIGASLRGDFIFMAGVLPAAAAIAGTVAAAAPSVASALGLAPDHCPSHLHHVHLCFVHSAGLRPALATLGAFALATFVFRASALAWAVLGMRRRLLQLEQISRRAPGRFPVFAVPGAPRLCHATGVLRPRILVSRSLLRRLGRGEARCALAHERAHLRRRDPLANLILAVAGLFVLPPLAARFQHEYRLAAEEACDADAADAVGDPALVADALVQVAAVQQAASFGDPVPAFGELALETRVRRLLAPTGPDNGPAHALLYAAFAAAGVAAFALANAASVHHAVETALSQLF